jgi:hypothetical protein
MGGDGLKAKFQVSAKKNIFFQKYFCKFMAAKQKRGVNPSPLITHHRPFN